MTVQIGIRMIRFAFEGYAFYNPLHLSSIHGATSHNRVMAMEIGRRTSI